MSALINSCTTPPGRLILPPSGFAEGKISALANSCTTPLERSTSPLSDSAGVAGDSGLAEVAPAFFLPFFPFLGLPIK